METGVFGSEKPLLLLNRAMQHVYMLTNGNLETTISSIKASNTPKVALNNTCPSIKSSYLQPIYT